MRHALAHVALIAFLGLPVTAQGNFIVPSKAATTEPGSVWDDSSPQSLPFWGTTTASTQSVVQYLYDVADIPAAASGNNLTGVAVRAPRGSSNQAATYQSTIIVSVSPVASTAAGRVFASNHGPAPVTVLSGTVSLPATSASPTWPAPWQTPIPFAAPVPYSSAAGQSLVIEFQTTGSSSSRSWSLEGVRQEVGRSFLEDAQPRTCVNSAGMVSHRWGVANTGGLVPGGALDVSLWDYPPGVPSLAANALFFGAGGVGSQFGPFTTPFPLASLGLPTPSGCEWAIDIAFSVPMVYVPSGYLKIGGVPLPNDPTLAGVPFYTQNLALDQVGGTTPSWFPSLAIRWWIGTGNRIPATQVSRFGSTLPSAGIVLQNAATLQLLY